MKYKKFFQELAIILLFATLLSGCYFGDGGAASYLTINRVIVVQGVPYVHGVVSCSYGIGGCEKVDSHLYYFSSTNGATWHETKKPPAEVIQSVDTPIEIPKSLCYSDKPDICFRIVGGKEQVQISTNGGSFWRVDWQMPIGRQYYQTRHSRYIFENVAPDTIPYDLALLETGEEHIVVVAMGNQGVLVRDSEGDWNRIGIAESPRASPIPYRATSLKELVNNIVWEWLIIGLISVLYFFVLSLFGLISLLFLGKSYRFIAAFAYLPLGSTVVLFVGSTLPFALWGLGVIPIYEIALALSPVIAVLIAVYSFRFQQSMAE